MNTSLLNYNNQTHICEYKPLIIKSGINKFLNTKIYLDTSSVNEINKISIGENITYDSRPSRANMQPIINSVWFAKMKGSYKNLIITKNDIDIIKGNILSTGFLGVQATDKLPLSLLSSIIISDNFQIQKDLNSVGTTMEGINNDTFSKILVPQLSDQQINEYNKKYNSFISYLSLLRRKVQNLELIKKSLLEKYF